MGKKIIIPTNMIIPIADELNRIAKGEILSDDWSKEIYSVDASHYSIKPSVIVCPFDEHDLSQICQYAYSKNTSITARGAGTGLLGQSLNDNIIVDFAKHMNKILEVGTDHVLVQPGLVKGILDKELKKEENSSPLILLAAIIVQLAVSLQIILVVFMR
ncbi:MAG: FAD-binding protein [Nitrososphaeraceae archaeon]